MWGRIRIRIVIWTYCLLWSVWFWITVIKSAKCLCLASPFSTQQGWIAFGWFTVLFIISCWELALEDD